MNKYATIPFFFLFSSFLYSSSKSLLLFYVCSIPIEYFLSFFYRVFVCVVFMAMF